MAWIFGWNNVALKLGCDVLSYVILCISLITLMGEIMNMGVYFGGGNEKMSVVFAILSTSGKGKLDLYLEFHFDVTTKVVENCVRFLSVIF